ncbi:MAG: hypothetical protein PVG30_08190 [Gammaproteobacteria bacterium]
MIDVFTVVAEYLTTKEKLNLVKAFSSSFKNYSFRVKSVDSFEFLKKNLKKIKNINQNIVVFLRTPLGNYSDCFFIRGVKKKVFCSEDSKYISDLRGLANIEVCVISKNHKHTEENMMQVISMLPNNFFVNKSCYYLLFLACCINEIMNNYNSKTTINKNDVDSLIDAIRLANENIYKKKEKNHKYIRVSSNRSCVFGIDDSSIRNCVFGIDSSSINGIPERTLNLSPLFVLAKFSYTLTLMFNEEKAHSYINRRKKKKGLAVAVYSKNGEFWFIANKNPAKKKLELQPKHKYIVKKIMADGTFPIKKFKLNKLKKILNTYPAFTFHVGAYKILIHNGSNNLVLHNELNKISSKNGDVVEFYVGEASVFIKTKNNKWFCWGDNIYGKLGLGRHTQYKENVWVSHDKLNRISSENGGIVKFHIGGAFVFIKMKNNKWFCWGNNYNGELGLGHTQDKNKPVPHNELNKISSKNGGVVEFHAGDKAVFVKTKNNKWFCWGNNDNGKLGLGHNQIVNNRPVPHDGLNKISSKNGGIVKFHVGERVIFIKTKNNKWFCWGGNSEKLGLEHNQIVNNRPVPHDGLNKISSENGGVVEFHVGNRAVFIKTKNNKYFYWGNNWFMQQLCNERQIMSTTPTLFFSGQKNLEEKIKKLINKAKEPQDKDQIRKLLYMMNKQKIVEADPNKRIRAMMNIELRYNSYNKRLMGK